MLAFAALQASVRDVRFAAIGPVPGAVRARGRPGPGGYAGGSIATMASVV